MDYDIGDKPSLTHTCDILIIKCCWSLVLSFCLCFNYVLITITYTNCSFDVAFQIGLKATKRLATDDFLRDLKLVKNNLNLKKKIKIFVPKIL